MKKAAFPVTESERLKALEEYEILDTPAERAYDDVVKLASHIAGMPISLISLVDSDRQWFKAKVGVDSAETPRDIAFCAHAILGQDPMVINDALKDDRFLDNPLVTGDPNVRFYAGIPLVTPSGHNLGTLCVMDDEPGSLSEEQIFGLTTLANQVIRNFELRRLLIEEKKKNHLIEKQRDGLVRSKAFLQRMLQIIGRDIREPLNGLKSMLQLIFRGSLDASEMEEIGPEALESIERSQSLIDNLVRWGEAQIDEEINPVEIPLKGFIENEFLRFQSLANENKVVWKNEMESAISVSGEPRRMKFIFRNLIENALRNTTNGSLSVSFETNDEDVLIFMKSSGEKGSSNTFNEAIDWKSLEKGNSGNQKGVSLLLISDFLRQMSAKMSVENSSGEETTLCLRFPRFREESDLFLKN